MKKLSRICALALLIGTSVSAGAEQYAVEDLGPYRYPAAINDQGEVVGGDLGSIKAFYYSRRTGEVQIPPHFGHPYSVARSINNRGQVVGVSYDGTGAATRGFLWDARTGVHDIPWLSGFQRNDLFAINNAGTTVGYCAMTAGFPWTAYLINQDGATRTIPAMDGVDINEHGQVVGQTNGEAAIWDARNGVRPLGMMGVQSDAFGLNNRGQVVGIDYDGGKPTELSGFVWDKQSGMTAVGTRLDDLSTYLLDINDRGQAVGYETDFAGNSYALIWDRLHGIRSLDSLLVPSSGWYLTYAFDINERGQIVGFGMLNGQLHGFLATPR